jgi:hypothetical protein
MQEAVGKADSAAFKKSPHPTNHLKQSQWILNLELLMGEAN